MVAWTGRRANFLSAPDVEVLRAVARCITLLFAFTRCNPMKFINDRCTGTPAHGFTLVELMIAIATLGILTCIAIPNCQQHLFRAKATAMVP